MNDGTIDLAAISKLMRAIDGDAEDLDEFVGDFAEISEELVAEIAAAIASADHEKLRIAAHTLKSNSKDMGAMHLSALSSEIEAACKAEVPQIDQAIVDEISTARNRAVEALTAVEFSDV